MSTTFLDLFSQYVGAAFAKQLAFSDLLGERGWGVDLQQGEATFGDDLTYPIQLLGTESDGDNSWLWAWGNEASELPKSLLKACNEIKIFGKNNSIQELTERSFQNEPVNGHMLAMVASGMNTDCCYYRGPYDGGALFFLVSDIPEKLYSPIEPQRLITVVSEVISQFEVNHKVMVKSLFQSQKYELSKDGETLIGEHPKGVVRISFDQFDRINNIEGALGPENSEPPKKKGWQFWKRA